MAMYSKNPYATMRDLMSWTQQFSSMGIEVAIDPMYLEDSIRIYHRPTGRQKKITRFELEDSADPKLTIVEAIKEVMGMATTPIEDFSKSLQQWIDNSLTQGASGQVYTTDNTSGQWISAPPAALNSKSYYPGTIGAMYKNTTEIVDSEDFVLREKMFSQEDQAAIQHIKTSIKLMWSDQRSLAERDHISYHNGFNTKTIVIAGGCFVSMLCGEPFNDIDVFLLSDGHNHEILKDLAHRLTNTDSYASGSIKIGNKDYMNNDNIEQTLFFKSSKFQYITTKYKTREELINHFDFKHCCVSYDFSTDKLYITREVFDLIKSKMLLPNNINKLPAPWRYEKFLGRGWKKPEIMITL